MQHKEPAGRAGNTLLPVAEDHVSVVEEHGHVREQALDAEREARRQLALAQIRQYPDPVLRMRARPVESFDEELRALAERMSRLMEDANGIGLAATQVGVLRRLIVFQRGEEESPTGLVNPEIVERSEELETDEEGCLSLQGVLVPVERHRAIVVEAKDVAGNDVRLPLEGLDARVVQHEVDHLDGVLILDRTSAEARRQALAALRPQPVRT
ncbi:MAG: peptide deformylase [Thermoleophilia bacterium]